MDELDKVLSPFLPNTEIRFAWDSTTLGALKTCPRMYKYLYIDGWQPKGESIHLRFGIEYHKALEEYDHFKLSGDDHETALRNVVRQLLDRLRDWDPDTTSRAGQYKNPRTLLSLVIDYCDKFADDPAPTIVREDGRPATELSFRFELDWGPQTQPEYQHEGHIPEWSSGPQPYVLCGHLDRVVSYNDERFVMDRKTTTTTPGSYYMDQWSPNNQMSLYTIAGQIVMNTAIRGVIIDAAQVLLEKPNNFVRGFTYRTQAQSAEWLNDLKFWLHSAENYATVGYWPQNDTACNNYGGCRFRGVCSRDPSVRERFLEADFVKLPPDQVWNPLIPR